MPSVTCPACSTAQAVEPGAGGYACASCGRSWVFVACDTCGSRFHSRPDSTGWTCPNCGTPHGTAAQHGPGVTPTAAATAAPPSLAMKGDDLDEANGNPWVDHKRRSIPRILHRPTPCRGEPTEAASHPGVFVAGGAVLVVLVAVFLFTRERLQPDDLPPAGAAVAKEQVCTDVRQLQTLRTDALGRAQDDLKAEAKQLQSAGDAATAKKVKKLVAAVGDYRVALEEQQDTTEASEAMGTASRRARLLMRSCRGRSV